MGLFDFLRRKISPPAGTKTDRKQLGRERLGGPVTAAFDALVTTVDAKGWADFRREPVGYYFSKMIGHWFLDLADRALSDEALARVSPADVHAAVLLLFRDMFRHCSAQLRPQTPDANWMEALFSEVSARLNLPQERMADSCAASDLDDLDSPLAKAVATPFGIMPQKLFMCHAAIIGGVKEMA